VTRLDPTELALRFADEPRYVDLRGLLLSGRCELFGDEGGLVARSIDFPFAAVGGVPSAEAILAAAEGAQARAAAWAGEDSEGEWHLLVQPEAVERVGTALPGGWRRRGVRLHRWSGELPTATRVEGAEMVLAADGHVTAGLDLDHLPWSLRHEMRGEHAARQPLAAALVDGRPVAYCYAAFLTESLWDVAVDTLQPYRRRGFAAACFRTLAAHLGRQGKRPVWGALTENEASLRLAAKLGFVPAAELTSFVITA